MLLVYHFHRDVFGFFAGDKLLYANRQNIKLLEVYPGSRRHINVTTIINNTPDASYLDFHWAKGILYWSDSTLGASFLFFIANYKALKEKSEQKSSKEKAFFYFSFQKRPGRFLGRIRYARM